MAGKSKSYKFHGFNVKVKLIGSVDSAMSRDGAQCFKYLVRVERDGVRVTTSFHGSIADHDANVTDFRQAMATTLDDLSRFKQDADEFVSIIFADDDGMPLGWTAEGVKVAGRILRRLERKGMNPDMLYPDGKTARKLMEVGRMIEAAERFPEALNDAAEELREKGLA